MFVFITGPISSVLVSIFGCRQVAVFGAFLAAVAFFGCTWSPNVQVMIILYGLLGGNYTDNRVSNSSDTKCIWLRVQHV